MQQKPQGVSCHFTTHNACIPIRVGQSACSLSIANGAKEENEWLRSPKRITDLLKCEASQNTPGSMQRRSFERSIFVGLKANASTTDWASVDWNKQSISGTTLKCLWCWTKLSSAYKRALLLNPQSKCPLTGGSPCPQGFLKIMQFSGNCKGKTRVLSNFWAQGPSP